jgi:hypothetical protein
VRRELPWRIELHGYEPALRLVQLLLLLSYSATVAHTACASTRQSSVTLAVIETAQPCGSVVTGRLSSIRCALSDPPAIETNVEPPPRTFLPAGHEAVAVEVPRT